MSTHIRVRTGWTIACVLILAGLLAIPAGAQEAALKIVVVDLERVVTASKQGKDLQAKLEAFQTQIQAEGEQKAAKARDIRQRITDGANSLSEEKLNELQKDLEDAGIDMRRFQDDKQREGQKMQTEGLRDIELKLKPVFEQIQNEGGYDLIFNNVGGVVVHASDKIDITDMVIERLNAASATAGN